MPKKLPKEAEAMITTLSKQKYSHTMISRELKKNGFVISRGAINNVINCKGKIRSGQPFESKKSQSKTIDQEG